ncbi:MAG: T9SS type A sorting domain-containing protein, partial [Ferruginibacter sp.]
MKKITLYIILIFPFISSMNASCIPVLNSLNSASATIYLDFDGQYVSASLWNGGNTFTCAPSGMSDAVIAETFNRVAEDYRPFNINITTDSNKFLAAPLTQRIRIIVTPTSAWSPGVGGIAYIGSFTFGDDTPGFVFCDRLPLNGPVSSKMVAEACSHESGHSLSLSHQSRYDLCSLTELYHSGNGIGITSWAPIMGNSYYRNMSGWNDGPTPNGCSDIQDNLSLITTQNGFSYRTDDYAEIMDSSAFAVNPGNININGIITTATDKDVFSLTVAQTTNLHIDLVPFSLDMNDAGADVDLKIELFDASAQLISTYDPPDIMRVSIDTILNAGTYYLRAEGTGNANTDNYGSLGSYTLSGFTGTLPIHNVTLAGKSDKGKHQLNWNIISDELIKNILVESSVDGNIFKQLTITGSNATGFSYIPAEKNDLYYRIKVTSVTGQSMYSNTVVLKAVEKTNTFMVSTLVDNEISITASGNYQYVINDANGRIISSGQGLRGINTINISNQPKGLYIIQLLNNNTKQA